jgi:hypothetical protein
MTRRTIAGAVLVSLVAAFAACDNGSDPLIVGPSTTFIAAMNSANERPLPNASTATGTATYVLTNQAVQFAVTVNGLAGPATLAAIHVGGAGVVGNIVFGFVTSPVSNGVVAQGTIDLTKPLVFGASTISGDSLRVLLSRGNAYTEVSTIIYGAGEIRGQILRQ